MKKIFFKYYERGKKIPYFHTDFRNCKFDLSKKNTQKSLAKKLKYTKCKAFYPVVRTGSPTPHPQENVGSKGGDTLACEGGGGGPIPTMGQTNSIIPLRAISSEQYRISEKPERVKKNREVVRTGLGQAYSSSGLTWESKWERKL